MRLYWGLCCSTGRKCFGCTFPRLANKGGRSVAYVYIGSRLVHAHSVLCLFCIVMLVCRLAVPVFPYCMYVKGSLHRTEWRNLGEDRE
jgi:hypothetical protein